MRFKYVAYNSTGEETTGIVEADSQQRAEETLWRSNLTISRISKVASSLALDEILPTIFGVKRQDLVTFSRDMASLLVSGIPLLQALRMLREQAEKASLKRVLGDILNSLEAGNSFSQACAKHPAIFPPLYLRLVEIGEEIGSLELVFRQITSHYEKELALQARIRSALTYPIMVIVLAVASLLIMVNFVLPAMMGLFTEFKAELPLITRILMAVAEALKTYGPQVTFSVILVAVLTYLYLKTPTGNRRKDYLVMQIPVIGAIIRKLNIGRIARTMVIMQRAGVTLTEILKILVQTTQNVAFKEALITVDTEIRQGRLLSQAFASHPLFTPLLVQMISVGEQTGRLETNMETLANYYEQEADRAINRATELIEPVMIVGAGGLVGFIAISIITPMYGIINQIQ